MQSLLLKEKWCHDTWCFDDKLFFAVVLFPQIQVTTGSADGSYISSKSRSLRGKPGSSCHVKHTCCLYLLCDISTTVRSTLMYVTISLQALGLINTWSLGVFKIIPIICLLLSMLPCDSFRQSVSLKAQRDRDLWHFGDITWQSVRKLADDRGVILTGA